MALAFGSGLATLRTEGNLARFPSVTSLPPTVFSQWRYRSGLLLAGALFSISASAAQLVDDRGVTVEVPASPRRIVALSPHLVEIVHAAGAGAKLAAAVRYSDYPESAKRLPRVGDASRFDVERILALEPDLVLGWGSGNPAHELARVERVGLPLFVTEPRQLTDIPRLVRTIGAVAGTKEAAEQSAVAFEREVERLRRRYSGEKSVRVFYEIWHRPLLTVNGRHMISDVIGLCGGRNVFADAPVLTPSVTFEAVLAAKPDVILGGSSAMRPGDLESEWAGSKVPALRGIPVRHVPADVIQRQTPRMIEGARVVCAHLDEVRQNK